MHKLRLASLFFVSLVGCGPDKGNNLTITLDPSDSFPNDDGNNDDDDDDDDDSAGETAGPEPTGGASHVTQATEVDVTATSTGASTTNETATTDPTVPDPDTTDPDPTVPDPDTTDPDPDTTDPDPTNFVGREDMAIGECDIWEENCPNGQKCMPYSDGGDSWDSLKCVPVMGTGKPGQACTVEGSGVSGIDDCQKHAMCFGVDPDNQGTCVGMCTGSEDDPTCPQGSTCSVSNMGVLILCLPGCDPLGDDCKASEVCVFNNDAFVCVLDASGGEGQQGDVCQSLNGCDPGLLCIDKTTISSCNQSFAGCCTNYCDVTMQDCPNALSCVPFFEEGTAPPGQENIGVCVD